jgi:hypothetical protein
MSYGTPEWQKWVLGEEEGIAQIKFACVIIITIKFKLKRHLLISMPPGPIRLSYENGIQTFDTANVSLNPIFCYGCGPSTVALAGVL